MSSIRSCAPPVAATRTPKMGLPKNACDAHCHIFGPADKFPYHPNRKYTPPDAPIEKLMQLHETLGFDRAVLVQATCHGDDNRAMLDALERGAGNYRGVAMVKPDTPVQEFETLNNAGIRGARFSFARHISGPPNFDAVRRTAEIAGQMGWHIELYLETEDVIEHIDILRSLPAPIVIDHMARVKTTDGLEQPAFQLLLELMRNEDFWVKISCAERLSSEEPPYADVVPFAQALIEASPDRILWGTDWPHPNVPEEKMPNDGDLVDLLGAYAPDEAVRHRILVDNPTRLFGF